MKYLIIFLLAIYGATNIGFAQVHDDAKRLDDKEIIVEKDRKIEFGVASRNFEKVKLPPPKKETVTVKYSFTDFKMPDKPVPVQMRILTIKQEELPEIYSNYVRAGIGTYASPFLHAYLQNGRSGIYNAGAEIKHFSSANGPVLKGKSGMGNTGVYLNGELYKAKLTLGGKIAAEHDVYHYYGYNTSALKEMAESSIKQTYNRFSGFGYANNYISSFNLKGQAGVGFNYIRDNQGASEKNLLIKANTQYKLASEAAVKIDGDISISSFNTTTQKTARNYVRVKPLYEQTLHNINFSAGAVIAYANDTLNKAGKAFFYPHITANYQIIKNRLSIFGGITGDLERVTYYTVTQENPWLAAAKITNNTPGVIQNLYLQNTNKQLDAFGGVKGSIGPRILYNAQAGIMRYKNLYFFNNSPLDSARFTMFYDRGATVAPYIATELTIKPINPLTIGLNLRYTNYKITALAFPGSNVMVNKALQRPPLKANLFANYNLMNKIIFTSELYVIGATNAVNLQTAGNENGTIFKKTNTLTELSLKVDYRFSDRFSAFIMANNLLGKKYQRYLYYPVQGFQAMAGISYVF